MAESKSSTAAASNLPPPATYMVTGNMVNHVPAAAVPSFVTALIASIPADVSLEAGAPPSIIISWLPGSPGMLGVDARLSGVMTQIDVVAILKALIAAEPDKAMLRTARLAVDIKG